MRPQSLLSGQWLRERGIRLLVPGVAMALAWSLTAYSMAGASPVLSSEASGHGPHASAAPDATGVLADPGRAAEPAPQPQTRSRSTVTLITGDRLHVDGGPGGALSITPVATPDTPASSAPFLRFTWEGDQYVVPAVATRYLGSLLDPRLFDVSYLLRAKLDDARRTLPVQVSGGGRAIPGLHTTGTSADGATGTLALGQSQALGRLLARAWRAGGRSPFPAGTWIGLAHAAGAPPLPPPPTQLSADAAGQNSTAGSGPDSRQGHAVPYYRLTVNFTGTNGQPAAAIGFVQNINDALHGGISFFAASGLPFSGVPSGPVSFSVPAGTYSLEFAMVRPVSGSCVGWAGALVVKPQVTVESNRTITLDARSAVPYRPVLHPAAGGLPTVRFDAVGLSRGSRTGGGLGLVPVGLSWPLVMGLISVSMKNDCTAATLSATPTPTVTKGILSFDASSDYQAAQPQPQQPTYYLDFPSKDKIPSSLTYTVGPANLTTVSDQLYHAPSGGDTGTVAVWEIPFHPWAGQLPSIFTPDAWDQGQLGSFETQVGNRTDYVYSASPRLDAWLLGFVPSNSLSVHQDVLRILHPGEKITETWDKGPQVVSPAAPTISNLINGGSPTIPVCPACRQDDNGTVMPMASGDSSPGHYGNLGGNSDDESLTSFAFYRDGRRVLDSSEFIMPDFAPPVLLPLLPRAATYRLVWALARTSDPAATTQTNWTFRSGPSDTTGSPPRGEECLPDGSRTCSFLPLLFLTYDLALNPDSQAPAGHPFQLSFTVRHQRNAPPPAGVAATVSASFDNGQTWSAPQHATSRGGDRFTATIQQPPLAQTSGFVSLRVTATDSAGNSVTQTIIKAYGLTS